MKVRFDQTAPYEVDEADVPFARPEGTELQARIYRPKGERDGQLAALGATFGDDAVAFVVALYPVADPLARYRYAIGRQNDGSGFDATRLVNAHHGYFKDEAAMAEASVTRIVESGEARALPPAWVAQPELDDNVPPAITEALVRAWQQAGGEIERVHFPGARHGFIQQPGADSARAITLIRGFIGRRLAATSRAS